MRADRGNFASSPCIGHSAEGAHTEWTWSHVTGPVWLSGVRRRSRENVLRSTGCCVTHASFVRGFSRISRSSVDSMRGDYNMKSRFALLIWIVLVTCIAHCTASRAATMGTAFTYQSRFDASGTPASGAYDFEFRLFDAATAGNQVGSIITKGDLTVNSGYFTTTLDFGAGIFTGDARWLQIAVRPGAETGSYTTLTPRHELTPSPYAINSYNEGTANYIPKFTSTGPVNSVMYESDGNIGIGTTTPLAKLAVKGDVLLGMSPSVGSFGMFKAVYNGNTTAYGVAASVDFYRPVASWGNEAEIRFSTNPGGTSGGSLTQRMVIDRQGNVGIGTANPSTMLHVSDGDVTFDVHTPGMYISHGLLAQPCIWRHQCWIQAGMSGPQPPVHCVSEPIPSIE